MPLILNASDSIREINIINDHYLPELVNWEIRPQNWGAVTRETVSKLYYLFFVPILIIGGKH